MNDEQRLQAITNMLILVRDNLFRGMSKSIQKLQARSINEVLELPNYTESPQRPWQGLNSQEKDLIARVSIDVFEAMHRVEAKLKERNT